MSDLICDHCGEDAPARLHLIVDVTSSEPDAEGVMRVERVRTRRHWLFCSGACRDAWWTVPTADNFHEVGTLETHVGEFAWGDEWKDRNLRLAAWKLAPGGSAELHAEEKFAAPDDLNAWWRS